MLCYQWYCNTQIFTGIPHSKTGCTKAPSSILLMDIAGSNNLDFEILNIH